MEEIEFLFDETLEERKKEFGEIINAFKALKPRNKDVLVLRRFTKALIKASVKKVEKPVYKPEIEIIKPVIQRPLQVLKPITLPKPALPVLKFKPGIEKIEKVKKPRIDIFKLGAREYNLITDKVTNKALATASVNKEYKLIEPELAEVDLKILNRVKKKIGKKAEKIIGNENLLIKQIKKAIKSFKVKESEDLVRNIRYYFIRDLLNLGKIDPLMHDENVSSISCSGVGEFVEVVHRGDRLKTNIIFGNKEELDSLVKKMAGKTAQKISEKEPVLDAVFDKHRFQATFGIGGVSSKFVITKI